eukprot:TRINITY_DN4058_c0_g1_i1.p1 TRINITY_DN4058_c0_g1~~TRINITY_DN4058_c0_g1_i1.p1  ORF type:complete len:354 (+),score=110.19 TRINITY_DN4058_c0_g1_i1:486-1547(+)
MTLQLQRCPDKEGRIELAVKATQMSKDSPHKEVRRAAGKEAAPAKDEERKSKALGKGEDRMPRTQGGRPVRPSPRKDPDAPQAKQSPVKLEDNKTPVKSSEAPKAKKLIPKESVAVPKPKSPEPPPQEDIKKPPIPKEKTKKIRKQESASKSLIMINDKASSLKSEALDLKGMPLEVIMVTAERLDAEKNKLQRQLLQCEKDLHSQIKQNLLDKEEFTQKANQLNDTIKKLEWDNSALADKSNLLEKSLSREMEALTGMSQETGLLSERLTQYLKHKNELEKQLSEISKELLSANNKCEALEKKKVDLEEELQEIKKEQAKTKTEQQAIEKALDELRKKLEESSRSVLLYIPK